MTGTCHLFDVWQLNFNAVSGEKAYQHHAYTDHNHGFEHE